MKSMMVLLSAIIMMLALSMAQENNSAVGGSEINSSTLKAILLSSEERPQSYVFTFDMDQKIDITNTTRSNKTESHAVSSRSFGVAALNLTARAMRIALAGLSMQKGQEENASSTASDIYLINDTLYMKVDRNWTKIPLAGLSLDMFWKQENEVGQQMDELNSSKVTFLGYDDVNGIDCYKIGIVPDMKAYPALSENLPTTSSAIGAINLSALFNEANISEVSWVSRDTLLPAKTTVLSNMTIYPEQLGLPQTEAGMIRMRIDTAETLEFGGFNRSINIILSEEAKTAATYQLPAPGNSSMNLDSTDIMGQ
jgi:hypothetical protein